ncbi:MAG: hypothetical protein J2P37_20270 [Ktedonobacteraceae bacterium]|nr:hypothetical protein [Ktedonobacteraceae bacterium]
MKQMTTTRMGKLRSVVVMVEPSDTLAVLQQTLDTVSQAPILILFLADPSLFRQADAVALVEGYHHHSHAQVCFVLAQADSEAEARIASSYVPLILAAEGPITRERLLAGLAASHQRAVEAVVPRKDASLLNGVRPPTRSARPRNWSGGRRGRMLAILALLIGSLLIGGWLVGFPVSPLSKKASLPMVVGQVHLVSSGQVSEHTSQGIMDQVIIDLEQLSAPTAGKRYYAWLLTDADQSDLQALLLGSLTVINGRASLRYAGDALHTNLLLIMSRFLVTEEDAMITPLAPSPDQRLWKYTGALASTLLKGGTVAQQHVALTSIRRLLAADPAFDQLDLWGGLTTWLVRDMSTIEAGANSLRELWEEQHDEQAVRQQTIRLLTLLDGRAWVPQDLTPAMVLPPDERQAHLGFVCVKGPNQDPPCVMAAVAHQVNGLVQVVPSALPEHSSLMEAMATFNTVSYELMQLRQDAQHLLRLTEQSLSPSEALTLINDMVNLADVAYVGQHDPIPGRQHQGVMGVAQSLQMLATLEVTMFHP